MDVAPGLQGDGLPGESRLASYGDDELLLTEHRLVYRGKGIRRNVSHAVHLRHVTGVSLRLGVAFRPSLLLVPAGIFLMVLAVTMMEMDYYLQEDLIFFGLWLSIITIPLPVLIPGHVLRVTTQGDNLRVAIPRRRLPQAREFIHQIEAARIPREDTVGPALHNPPTASPYSR